MEEIKDTIGEGCKMKDESSSSSNPAAADPPLQFSAILDPANPQLLFESAVAFLYDNSNLFSNYSFGEMRYESIVAAVIEKKKQKGKADMTSAPEPEQSRGTKRYKPPSELLRCNFYTFDESDKTINILISVPVGTEKDEIVCELKGNRLRFVIEKGEQTVPKMMLEGELFGKVAEGGMNWELEEDDAVKVVLVKGEEGEVWKTLLVEETVNLIDPFPPSPSTKVARMEPVVAETVQMPNPTDNPELEGSSILNLESTSTTEPVQTWDPTSIHFILRSPTPDT